MKAGLGSRVIRTTFRLILVGLAVAMCVRAQQPAAPTSLQVQAQPGSQETTAIQPSTGPPPNSAPNGAQIFAQRCSTCHGDRGQGISVPSGIAGPSLQAVHEHGDVVAAMQIGPSHMPRFAYVLSMREMDAVADYVTQELATIPVMQGEIGQGGELYRAYCGPCHHAAARGGVMVYTGVDAPDISHKSPALIAGAIRWGPGPMPSFPPTVLNDKQLWSIVDYVQLMKKPPQPGGNALHWMGPVPEGLVAWVTVFVLIGVVGWIERGGKG